LGRILRAIKANGFVFVSGQVPLDPQIQQVINGDIVAQTRRVLDNIAAILRAAGSDLNKVVRTTVYLRFMTDFPAMTKCMRSISRPHLLLDQQFKLFSFETRS
jgi:2-iminobutanoate/2-iminopropanoate deaminase